MFSIVPVPIYNPTSHSFFESLSFVICKIEIVVPTPTTLRIVKIKRSNICENCFLGLTNELPCWLMAVSVFILQMGT